MKKNLTIFAAILCCAFAFVACQKPAGNNNKPANGEEQNNNGTDDPEDLSGRIAKVVLDYGFKTTEDLLKLFDFQMVYLDPKTGEKHTENISSVEFSKQYTDLTLPVSFGYKFTTTLKEGVTIDAIKDIASVNYFAPEPVGWISLYDKDDHLVTNGGHRAQGSLVNISGTKVAERFSNGQYNQSYFETVNEKGQGTTGEWVD